MKQIFVTIFLTIFVGFALPSENDENWMDGVNYLMLAPLEVGVTLNNPSPEYSLKVFSLNLPVELIKKTSYTQIKFYLGFDLCEMNIVDRKQFDFSIFQPTIAFKALDKTHNNFPISVVNAMYLKVSPLSYAYTSRIKYSPRLILGNEFFMKRSVLSLNTLGLNLNFSIPLDDPNILKGIFRIGVVYRILGWHMQPV